MTTSADRSRMTLRASLAQALQGLRAWTSRQILVAVAAGVGVTLVIGFVTVLIPNNLFARDIPPVWWNYPVWIITSALSGMLLATYVNPSRATSRTDQTRDDEREAASSRRTGRLGMAGGILAWFAVGCPVCNKIALLALGYSGAITWFAPVQPFLAVAALALTAVALVWRLRGQISCPVRPTSAMAA
ncbi:MAG: hypothetical protein WBA87_10815 [Microbacterium sp.]